MSPAVAEHLIAQHSAIKMLHSRVKLILEYVRASEAGEWVTGLSPSLGEGDMAVPTTPGGSQGCPHCPWAFPALLEQDWGRFVPWGCPQGRTVPCAPTGLGEVPEGAGLSPGVRAVPQVPAADGPHR